MSTDAGMTSAESTALSAELEKAAALLRSKGLDHAAAQLLAPEAQPEKVEGEAAVKAPKLKIVKTASTKVVRKAKTVKAKTEAVKAKTVKARTKKVVKAKAVKAAPKRKPVSGQSGPRIAELAWDDLNKKEKLLLGVFDLEGEREVRTIEQIGSEAFKNQPLKKQNSWTRNSLRRVMRAGIWLEKTAPGKYRLTQAARTKLRG
jgi:hypothetical protein